MSVEDDESLSAKILLMQASNRSRVKAWMKPAPEADSNSPDDQLEQALKDIKPQNENVGIGFIPTVLDNENTLDDLTQANEALRRKLLSKDALRRHQQSQSTAQVASKPMPKQQKFEVSDESETETKGKSRKKQPTKTHEAEPTAPEVNGNATVNKSKKRPGSYMDQLLADRRKKLKTTATKK